MPPVGFEPMISVLERAKTVRALDRAATAIGKVKLSRIVYTCPSVLQNEFCRKYTIRAISHAVIYFHSKDTWK
jgi:hypothetical protein